MVCASAEAGNLKLLRGGWIEIFLEECEQFSPDEREYEHDDQVDAACGGFNYITTPQPYAYTPVPRYGSRSDGARDDWDQAISGGYARNVKIAKSKGRIHRSDARVGGHEAARGRRLVVRTQFDGCRAIGAKALLALLCSSTRPA
jgi:hypothetical protein